MKTTLPPGLPDGAIPIVRNGTSASTLYTVAAGRLLHIVAAYVGTAGSSTVGRATLTATVYKDAARTILEVVAIANGGDNAQCDALDIHVGPTGTVVLGQTGLTGPTLTGGFIGWEEPLLPGTVV